MAAARTELIEEIRSRTDLVGLVGEYLPLKKSGRRYIGLCPFHAEKTPSFSVNPEGQFFYCFGCKAGGDAFEFIMRVEGLDFPSAARLLAERAGLRWDAETPEEQAREKRRAAFLQLNLLASEVFRRALLAPQTGLKARRYAASRGISPRAVERFRLGFAPEGPRTLAGIFRRRGRRLEDAAALGLVIATADGYIDRFRNRLIFPLIDVRGRVVGFGGRALEATQQPKYLNSPESELFQKGRFLYALDAARDAIRRADMAVLVEGYLDAITAHEAGLANVVATLGTAPTAHHAELLKRYASRVVLAYDGDRAGQEATVRGLEIMRRAGLAVQVAVLPPGRDPDELIRQEGPDSFASLIAAAAPLTEYLLARALSGADLTRPEGRAEAVRACLPVLAEVASAAARDGYLRQVAKKTRVSEDLVAADLAVYLRNLRKERHIMDNSRQDSNTNRCGVSIPDSTANPAEKELLRAILKEYSLLARIREVLRAEDFADGPLRDIFELLLRLPGEYDQARLLREASEDIRPVLIELLAGEENGEGPPPHPVAKLVERVKEASIRRQLARIDEEIHILEQKGDYDRLGLMLLARSNLLSSRGAHGLGLDLESPSRT